MPATAITTFADASSSRYVSSLCMPATPTSYTLVTLFPRTSAVRAASSDTYASLVPPDTITISPCFSLCSTLFTTPIKERGS